MKKLPENPEFAEMWHGDIILTLQWSCGTTSHKHVAVRFLSFPRAGPGLDLSHMGKNNGDPNQVCEKRIITIFSKPNVAK